MSKIIENGKSKKDRRLSVSHRLERDLVLAIENIAESEGRSRSNWIEMTLKDAVAQHEGETCRASA